jgi:hypothetical protein
MVAIVSGVPEKSIVGAERREQFHEFHEWVDLGDVRASR